jgi:hypothetical protein
VDSPTPATPVRAVAPGTDLEQIGGVRLSLALVASLAAGGCFYDMNSPLPDDFASCPDEANTPVEPAEPIDGALTYYGDARPIIDARCAGCHVDGGIGPFPLTTYDEVFFNKDAARSAIAGERMPPWDPNDCCREYLHDRSLTDVERQILLAWVDQGAAPGDPAEPGEPIEPITPGISRVDLTLEMAEPFSPRPVVGNDEVRCFLIDWPLDELTYVTGVNVKPGNLEVVHHVAVLVVDEGDAADLQKRVARDGRPGFECAGDIGALPEASIGGWTPGETGFDLPEGLGRKIPPGGTVLLQMHYDLSSGSTAPDRTSIELKLDAEVERESRTLPVGNPQWLIGAGLDIEAGSPDSSVWFAYDPTRWFGRGNSLELFSATIHMHDYGSAGRVAILRADGSTECLLDVPLYDFSWHGEYLFREPVVIDPGDKIYVECHFDNSAGNQKLIDGELEEPGDLHWGTDQEMCGALLMIAEAVR